MLRLMLQLHQTSKNTALTPSVLLSTNPMILSAPDMALLLASFPSQTLKHTSLKPVPEARAASPHRQAEIVAKLSY